jgi:transcriptional regulator of aromatic amino acid metabolism
MRLCSSMSALAHAINKRICSLDVKVTLRLSIHAEQELFYTSEEKVSKNLLAANQLRGKKTLIETVT